MEIIKNFGVNPYLLVAQIVNFLILFYVLKRFAYKPIFKMLEDRKKTIQEGIANAQDAQKALDKALEEEKRILKLAQSEAQKIVEQSKNQAQIQSEEMHSLAKTQVEKMISDASEQIAKNSKQVEKELALSVSKLAMDMLEDSLSEFFDPTEQKSAILKLSKKFKTKKI
jgi:F-type H+-transporting ATPase subunit b